MVSLGVTGSRPQPAGEKRLKISDGLEATTLRPTIETEHIRDPTTSILNHHPTERWIMVSAAFIALTAVAIVSCLSMAWALGASSNSPPFAPAIGANAIPTIRAALLIGILAALGAVTQGGVSPRRSDPN